MKTTVLGGILVILPLAVIALLAIEGFQISVAATRSIEGILPIRTWLGLAAFNAMAVLLTLAACFGAGLLARLSFVSKRVAKLDKAVSSLFPGYSAAKSAIGGVDAVRDGLEDLTPVLVEMHGSFRFGLEVERTREDLVIVYFPTAPNPQIGAVEAIPAERVQVVSLPAQILLEDLRQYGRGCDVAIDTLRSTLGSQ